MKQMILFMILNNMSRMVIFKKLLFLLRLILIIFVQHFLMKWLLMHWKNFLVFIDQNYKQLSTMKVYQTKQSFNSFVSFYKINFLFMITNSIDKFTVVHLV